MWILLSENISRKKKKSWILDFIDFSNINIVIWIFISLLASLFFIIFIFYKFLFIWNFDKLTNSILEYNKKNIIINWSLEDFKWLKYQEDFLKKIEIEVKEISEEKQKDLVWRLNSALPDILEKEFVIKFFEDLFLTISSKESPVVLNSINIMSPVDNILKVWWDDIHYKKYPLSLWFSSSDEEFNRILDIIQVSWLFDKRYYFRWEILPVMTVSSVTMNFDKNDSKKEVDNILKSRSLQIFMYSYWDDKTNIKK